MKGRRPRYTRSGVSLNFKLHRDNVEFSSKWLLTPSNNLNSHPHFHKHSKPGPEVIKLFPCSTQLSMKFFPLIDVKMPTIVGILTSMSGKNNILGLTEP